MKKVILIIVLLFANFMFSQRNVVGKIVDSREEPIPGATIIEKGKATGSVTDFNGNFEISVSSGESILEVSFLGYEKQEVKIENKNQLNIKLKEQTNSLKEVVVTGFSGVIGKARKRTESIQNTPESVTALNAKGIESAGVTDISSFSSLVPNLKFNTSQGVGLNFITIRGIPQVRGGDAPVAFVIDGVTIPDPSLLSQELYDLALIEVVKGPQGALYGKNAIGGAINIYTKDPTNSISNKIKVGYGNGNNRESQFISSGAIKKDKLFYRFSGQYKEFDGLLTNQFLNQNVDFKKDLNLRGQLKAKITDNFTISGTYQYFKLDGGAAYYSVNPTGNPTNLDTPGGILDPNPKKGNNEIVSNVLGSSNLINNYGNIKMVYNFENSKLESITSINKSDRNLNGDLDFLPDDLFTQNEKSTSKVFNQEIRLSNRKVDTKIDWSLGGFYQNIKKGMYQEGTDAGEQYLVSDYINETKTVAFFGFADYKILTKLTASVAFRYDIDRFTQQNFLFETAPSRNNNEFQPKFSLSYTASKNVLFYANFGRGYRTGGFNAQATDIFSSTFKDETTDNYEFGFKTSSFNNRIIFNGSAFYTNFKNQQQSILDLNTFIGGIYNYNKSKIVGFELESRFRMTNFLDVFANYGLTNSKIIDGGTTGGEDGLTTDNTLYNNNRTPFVPVDNYGFGLESSFQLTEKIKFNGFLNLNTTGKTYWHESNRPEFTSNSYSLLSANFGFEFKKWKLEIWGKNLTDKQYYQEFSPGEFVGSPDDVAWRGQPLSIGTSVSVTF